MAFQITNLKRTFKIVKGKGKTDVELADPNPNMSPEEVVKFYASDHPELTNSLITGPTVVKDTALYTMTVEAGQLG